MSIKTNTTNKTLSTKPFLNYNSQANKRSTEKGESTPAEDEGISSSEQELSQDEDYTKARNIYGNSNELKQNLNSDESRRIVNKDSNKCQEKLITNNCTTKNYKNIRCGGGGGGGKMKETNVDDGNEIIRMERESNDEDETTIDEVIEELENIVNDAKTEAYANEQIIKTNASEKINSCDAAGKTTKQEMIMTDAIKNGTISARFPEKEIFEETEIIPSYLHPQPPRKAKSLVHIYFPSRDFDGYDHHHNHHHHHHVKSGEFFDEDTDTESSDSLLTATREKKSMNISCRRSLNVTDSFGSFSSTNTRSLFIKHEKEDDDYQDENELKLRAKLQGYEERNIDEEEIKRKHLKIKNNQFNSAENSPVRVENFSSQFFFKDNKFMGDVRKTIQKDFINDRIMNNRSTDRINDNGFNNFYEKAAFFQSFNKFNNNNNSNGNVDGKKFVHENSFTRSPQKIIAPTPVKRSQTFHITTTTTTTTSSETDPYYKRGTPKPKMGVSGIDFQRNMELKAKNDNMRYSAVSDYKKNMDANDKRSKKILKESLSTDTTTTTYGYYENGSQIRRRGSFNSALNVVEIERDRLTPNGDNFFFTNNNNNNNCGKEILLEKPCAKARSKSLEKMDEGLDSLVDIVYDETKKGKIKPELNVEMSKNIGPRTRRSLAESSLFNPPNTTGKHPTEESPKPPKPAQRTSITRHNSTSRHDVTKDNEKISMPGRNSNNSGMRVIKTEDGGSFSVTKRCPPDGSSSPNDYNSTSLENRNLTDDKIPIYSVPVKQQSKLQKYFGSPKFENHADVQTTTTTTTNHQNVVRNGSNKTNEMTSLVSPMPRNVQQNVSEENKNHHRTPNTATTAVKEYKPVFPKRSSSKPNFLLGTYQSQDTKNIPKPSSSVLNSVNAFNSTFLAKKPQGNVKMYPSSKTTTTMTSTNCSSQNRRNLNVRQSMTGNSSPLEKLTDSPSGLY